MGVTDRHQPFCPAYALPGKSELLRNRLVTAKVGDSASVLHRHPSAAAPDRWPEDAAGAAEARVSRLEMSTVPLDSELSVLLELRQNLLELIPRSLAQRARERPR
jgi:hypothetical protein